MIAPKEDESIRHDTSYFFQHVINPVLSPLHLFAGYIGKVSTISLTKYEIQINIYIYIFIHIYT